MVPAAASASWRERLRACAGALLGILLTGWVTRAYLGPGSHVPILLASMGASSVLLFAAPASPLAQPWPLLGGNVLAATVGVFFAHAIADPVLASALAIAAALVVMFSCRCLHPPSGAVALTAVLGGPAITDLGYQFVLVPIALNTVLLLMVALAFNNATRHRYPNIPHDAAPAHGTSDPKPMTRLGFTADDLDAVIRQYDQVLDVSREDLESLFERTEMQAYRRRFGAIRCADIMSRDVVAVEFGTTLEQAWALLHERHVAALPVIDRARRIIGIVTQSDFVRHADVSLHADLTTRLRTLLTRIRRSHSEKPEVVGQIMASPVATVEQNTHIVELVPLMANSHPHHLPIVDGERRLVGMVTQSDLIAGLYHRSLSESTVR
jgi:CBS domain-containing membrane protein